MKIHTFTLGPFQTNSYLVEDETERLALLIDPTIGSESMYDYITAHNLHVPLIIDTHGHIDHVYGNAFFKEKTEAALVIHEDDAQWLDSVAEQAMMFGVEVPVPVAPDRLLKDGDLVEAGHLSFKVIHTPGHTPGGICLYGHNVLLSGDTLFAGSIGRTDLPGGDYETLIASIKQKLLVLPDQTIVYSGHGRSTTIGEEREYNPFLE